MEEKHFLDQDGLEYLVSLLAQTYLTKDKLVALDAGTLDKVLGLSADGTLIKGDAIVDKLKHILTIGDYKFDGSEDVTVPVYKGEMNNDDIANLASAIQEMNMTRIANSYTMNLANSLSPQTSTNTMTLANNGTMTLIEKEQEYTMSMGANPDTVYQMK